MMTILKEILFLAGLTMMTIQMVDRLNLSRKMTPEQERVREKRPAQMRPGLVKRPERKRLRLKRQRLKEPEPVQLHPLQALRPGL
jgi:hypothetical protein